MSGTFDFSNLGAVWQSADFNHYLPCIEQLQRLGESFVEHDLQLTIGDVAASHPYQLGRRPVTGDQFYEVAVFADNNDALLLGCLEYYCVRSIAQTQCS